MWMQIKKWLLVNAERAVPSLRLWALQLVLEAEEKIPGKTGTQKREYVVRKLDEAVRLPWWLEPFDAPLFGLLVDIICNRLNEKHGHVWNNLLAKEIIATTFAKEQPR